MKAKSISLLAALSIACACQIQEIDSPVASVGRMTEEREVTLIASLEDGSPDTKTEMVVTNEGLSNAKYEVFWLPGDKITVFSNGASSVFTSRNTEKTKTAEGHP